MTAISRNLTTDAASSRRKRLPKTAPEYPRAAAEGRYPTPRSAAAFTAVRGLPPRVRRCAEGLAGAPRPNTEGVPGDGGGSGADHRRPEGLVAAGLEGDDASARASARNDAMVLRAVDGLERWFARVDASERDRADGDLGIFSSRADLDAAGDLA